MNSCRRMIVIGGVLILASTVAACAPGEQHVEPPPPEAALSFAFTGAFADLQISAFEAALSTRSRDAVSVSVDEDFDQQAPGFEQRVIEAVSSGDLDLGWIGVRAFSEVGIHQLEPLLAPFLLDSVEAQRKVIASDLDEKLLASLDDDDDGVLGLGLMAGPVRHPIAAGVPLRGIGDYAGIPFFSTHTVVTLATVAALGAQVIDVSPDERNAGIEAGTIRAYDNSVVFMAHVPDWPVNQMTANVGLFPSMGVLIVNPATFDALSQTQQEALLAAAQDASAESPALSADRVSDVTLLCAVGARFALASPDDLAQLRAAVEPVYVRLRAQAGTAELIDELIELKGATPPDIVPYPAACAAP